MDLMDLDERSAFVNSIRELADYLERNPGLPISKWAEISLTTSSSEMDPVDKTSPTHLLRRMKEPGRMVKKEHQSSSILLRVTFGEDSYWGPRVSYGCRFDRDTVCTARVVATEERKVFGKYVDEEKAAELKQALADLQATELVPVVEYDCAPILKA